METGVSLQVSNSRQPELLADMHQGIWLARKQNLKLHTIVQLLASKQKPSARLMRDLLCNMLPKDFNVLSKFINNVNQGQVEGHECRL
jgi:hypothetical protein